MSQKMHSLAKAGGWVDQVYSTIGDLIHNCELIIIGVPYFDDYTIWQKRSSFIRYNLKN